MFQSLYHLCAPLLVSLLIWGVQNSMHYWMWSHWSGTDGKDHLPHPAHDAFPKAAQDVSSPCFLPQGSIASLCSTWLVFPAVLLCLQLPPRLYWCTNLFLPRWRTLHFPFWNLRFISVFAESEVGASAQVINEEVEQYWQVCTLRYSTSVWPLTGLCNCWSQPFAPRGSARFPIHPTPLCLACASSWGVWGCYRRQCQRWSASTADFPNTKSFVVESCWVVRHDFPFVKPCWLIQITFLSICLQMAPMRICSLTFPGIEMRLASL